MEFQAQIARFIYSKNGSNIRGKRKMPQGLKAMTRLYEKLDLNDLAYLTYKAHKMRNSEQLSAIHNALSGKSFDSEEIRKRVNRTFMLQSPSEETINVCYKDLLVRDINCIVED